MIKSADSSGFFFNFLGGIKLVYLVYKNSEMPLRKLLLILLILICFSSKASFILLPMDETTQQNHLKAYGITYWCIDKKYKASWLLNYRGGSFLLADAPEIRKECQIRGVSFEVLSDAETNQILEQISSPSQNMEAVVLEKAPKVAVYTPKGKQPWDDAVTLVLTYAEIPFTPIYDEEVLSDQLILYDWLHLHHEDFTGQYGKFFGSNRNSPWYIEQKKESEILATKLGYKKVSEEKGAVSKKIRDFVIGGGFMFAMCSATDSFDIALAADGVDICESMFDGDASEPNYQSKINFGNSFAFKDFILDRKPEYYEFSNIDMTEKRRIPMEKDYFTLMEFSAKWDPIPSMLCQNHTQLIKGFMGQTTAFDSNLIKSNVLLMGSCEINGEARYIHGEKGKGMYTFFGGHDPEDYQHRVGDAPTVLDLHPNSPGYRLILNNVLFPAARKKKQKT